MPQPISQYQAVCPSRIVELCVSETFVRGKLEVKITMVIIRTGNTSLKLTT